MLRHCLERTRNCQDLALLLVDGDFQVLFGDVRLPDRQLSPGRERLLQGLKPDQLRGRVSPCADGVAPQSDRGAAVPVLFIPQTQEQSQRTYNNGLMSSPCLFASNTQNG